MKQGTMTHRRHLLLKQIESMTIEHASVGQQVQGLNFPTICPQNQRTSLFTVSLNMLNTFLTGKYKHGLDHTHAHTHTHTHTCADKPIDI